ncbi:MAG: hypothetical protein WAK48_07115 [Candidatus Acidiferrum sp.]|jgi:hypothetical protein
MKTHQYRLVLYENASPMEYDADEIFTFSYLRTRFQSEAAAKQILDDLAEAIVAVDRLPLYNLRTCGIRRDGSHGEPVRPMSERDRITASPLATNVPLFPA